MASIAKIATILTVNSEQFNSGLAAAQAKLKNFAAGFAGGSFTSIAVSAGKQFLDVVNQGVDELAAIRAGALCVSGGVTGRRMPCPRANAAPPFFSPAG